MMVQVFIIVLFFAQNNMNCRLRVVQPAIRWKQIAGMGCETSDAGCAMKVMKLAALGGRRRDRTGDLRVANAALSQLS